MSITVKRLAKLSGVSIRTLHYYDEIGLLNPAYYGDNQYRYYNEEQLLLLQQILFYRDLGFPLNDIKEILQRDDFDKITALKSHKENLIGNRDRINRLINTIDKTITHLRGNKMVKLEEIFDGFTEEKQDYYEKFLVKQGVDPAVLEKSKQNVKHWTKEQWLQNKKENDEVHAELCNAIDQGLASDSKQVQEIVRKHFELTKIFWTPNRETYIGLGELYRSNSDFEAFFDNIHPKLLDFLIEAMNYFAVNNLS